MALRSYKAPRSRQPRQPKRELGAGGSRKVPMGRPKTCPNPRCEKGKIHGKQKTIDCPTCRPITIHAR